MLKFHSRDQAHAISAYGVFFGEAGVSAQSELAGGHGRFRAQADFLLSKDDCFAPSWRFQAA